MKNLLIFVVMNHVTTDKGDIGVLRITADLISQGISVFNPISATCPFDILIYHKNQFKRVQVKYRTALNGRLSVDLKRATIVNGRVISTCRNNEVDILAIYCPDNQKCYYINSSEITKTVSLRVSPSKNNQAKNIKFAYNYEVL